MRVILTGIDGFVGSHAAEFLLRIPGVEVHGIVLDPANVPNITHIRNSLHLHKADILESGRLASLFAELKPDRVIHLAGQAFVPASFADPVPTFRANVLGGVHVLEAARLLKDKAPALVVVSTGEIYGRTDRVPVAEDFPLAPNNPYAASKAGIDLIAQQYAETFGLRVIVPRPFNHAGPRQSPVFVCSDFAKQIAEVAAGRRKPEIRVGNIDTQRDFTDVRDVVRAYWLLLERNATGVFNVCAGRPLAVRKVLESLASIAAVRIDIITEQTRLRSYDIPVIYGSNRKLADATGWKAEIPLEQTLRETYEYWKAEIGRK
jgi:GDP-4-dehydro-6-deoxy-D-mannose reductase